MVRRRRPGWKQVRAVVLVALTACSVTMTSIPPDNPSGPKTPAGHGVLSHDPADDEDVLERARQMNSDAYAKPSREFRQGHVSVKHIDAGAITRGERRFEVRMPSGAPVTTPAVYRGMVLASGGFQSKEFYAFALETGKPVWGIQLDDDGPSAPACEDGVCVFNTESCTVFAVEARTGKQLWSWWLGDPLISAPAIANGRVFTSYPAVAQPGNGKKPPPGATHALAAFDLKSGKLLWQKWIDADVMSAPVAVERFVYATSFAGTIYKLDQRSGELLAAKARRATSAPVFDERGMYYTRRIDDPSSKKAVQEAVVFEPRPLAEQSVNVSVGVGGGILLMGGGAPAPVIQYEKAAPYLDPSVQDRSKYSDASKANDSANGLGSGQTMSANAHAAHGLVGQGSVSSLQAFQGSRILRFGNLSINSMGDEVVGLDDSKARWSHKLRGDARKQGGFLAAPPVAAGGRIVVGTLDGSIETLDPKSGKRLRRYPVGHAIRSQPVVHAGWIYVGTDDGRLVGIDTRDRTLSGWPMWGANAARTGLP